MTSPVGRALMEEELEVAWILSQLPKLVSAANSRRLPDFLRWGARRRRSALDDSDPLLPPPPPLSAPPDGNDERKDGATSSPTTPLSFPPSGGEEPDTRPPRPPRSSPSKAIKNTKRHKEWVKEQSQLIALLSDRNANLQRSIAEYSAVYEKLKAKNSWLRDLQSKVRRGVTEEVGQRQSQRRDGSSGLAPPAPTSIQPPATRSMVDPHHHATTWEMGRAVPPPPPAVDAAAGAIPPPPAWRDWGAERRASLDLNARPEEEEEGEVREPLLQSSAYKAAMSAQARKRRLEIQREKNSYHSTSSSSSLFSRAHKMQRFR